MSQRFKIEYSKRIYGFDLLRALAILFVVHGHGRGLLSGTFLEDFPWIRLPHGVDIFFVLSGFLIGYRFISSYEKNQQNKFSNNINFWIRSAFRILPNYYLFLAINYFLVKENILPGNTNDFHYAYFITFTQNLISPFYNFFWESWSLAVQEWFYLLFPLFLFLCSKVITIKKSVLLLSISFILLSFSYRYFLSFNEYDSFWWDVTFRKTVATRIDTIFYGVIAAFIRFYYSDLWKKYSMLAFIIGLCFFLITIYVPNPQNSLYRNVFYLGISPFFIAFWFPFLDKLKNFKTKLGKLITFLSIISYGIYLLNLLFIQIINYKDLLSGINNNLLKYALFYILVISGASILYFFYENPIVKIGNTLFHTRRMMSKNN